MNKINLAFLGLLLFLASCSKNDIPSSENVNYDLISEVEQLSSSTIALGYMKLNPEEKVVFWHHHYDKFLSNPNESDAVKAHVRKIKAFTTADIYRTLESAETQKKLADFTKEWFDQAIAENQFDKDKLLTIGTFIGIKKDRDKLTLKSLRTSSTFENPEECNCYYSLSCPGTQSCNETQYCKDHGVAECGLFGSSTCTGKCGF